MPTATPCIVDGLHATATTEPSACTSRRCARTHPSPGSSVPTRSRTPIIDGFGGADDRHRDGHRRPVADHGEPRARRHRPPARVRHRSTSPTSRTSGCAHSTSTSRTRRSPSGHRSSSEPRSSSEHRSSSAPRSPSSLRSPSGRHSATARRCRRSPSTIPAAGRHCWSAHRSPASRRRASRSRSSSRCTTTRSADRRRLRDLTLDDVSFFDGTPVRRREPGGVPARRDPGRRRCTSAARRGAIGSSADTDGRHDLRVARRRPDDDVAGARRRRRCGTRCSPSTPICAVSRSPSTSARSSSAPRHRCQVERAQPVRHRHRSDHGDGRARCLAGGRLCSHRRHPGRRHQPDDGAYGRRDLVVDCTHGFDCSAGATLGQAKAAGALRPGAHVARRRSSVHRSHGRRQSADLARRRSAPRSRRRSTSTT